MFNDGRKDRIGQLSEYVTIYKVVTPKDTTGAIHTNKEVFLENINAFISYNNAEEKIEDNKILLTQSLNCIIRKVDIDETFSVQYKTKAYNIVSIIPVGGRNNYIQLKLIEKDE